MGIDQLVASAVEVQGVKIVAADVPGGSPQSLRDLIDQLRRKAAPVAVLLGTKQDEGKVLLIAGLSRDLVDRGLDSVQWIREAAALVGGKGGGRADMAQAGGKLAEKLAEALELGRKEMEKRLATRALIGKMDDALLPLFQQCILPIYAEQDGSPVQCGTGTLFRVADTSFLVTASHVADIAAVHKYQLYITDATQGSNGIALEGNLHSERNLDVAVWELTSRVVAELPNRKFLTVHHADRTRSRLGKGWFYVHGYPNIWSVPNPDGQRIAVKPFTYGAVLYDGPTNIFEKYDPNVHLLLAAPNYGNVDSQGIETEMPESLAGISGCSLWQAYYEGLPPENWNIDDAVIVAVQTGTYKNGTVVKGTFWWVVNEIIVRNYPNLKRALDIITPHERIARR